VEIVGLLGVPAAMGDASEHSDDVNQIETSDVRYRVLSVGRKNVVLRSRRESRADLGALLPNTWHPERHLSLTLKIARPQHQNV
jgi:hypothetical protein